MVQTIQDVMKAVFEKYLIENGSIDDLAYKFYSALNSTGTKGFKDLISSVNAAGVPPANAPTMESFGPSGSYEAFNFSLDDYVYLLPFHVNHDIVPGGKAFLHVHWSTNGTNIQPVRWQLEVMRSKGHNQEAFSTPVLKTVTQAASGTAWKHMVTEVGEEDALIMTEPDELILVVLRRVSNGGVDNTDKVFGLMCDLHYESDRDFTPRKAPNFYISS